jgi:hypothetical protein
LFLQTIEDLFGEAFYKFRDIPFFPASAAVKGHKDAFNFNWKRPSLKKSGLFYQVNLKGIKR